MIRSIFIVFSFLLIPSLYSQVNDTVSDISNDCLNKEYINDLQIQFENDSITISGEILMNCWPRNYLFREVREDSIFLIAADTCAENCLCMFAFSTSMPDPGYDSIYVSLGHQCILGNDYYYEHYFDTLIVRNWTLTQNLCNDLFQIFPNPVLGIVKISLINDSDWIERLTLYQMNGNKVQEVFYTNEERIRILDLTNLKAGIYFIQIETRNSYFSKKLIKI